MICLWNAGDLPVLGVLFGSAAPCRSRKRKVFVAYEAGASATVPAWTFGREYAKENWPVDYKTALVEGVYVCPSDDGKFAMFVWNTPDGDKTLQLTKLSNVIWEHMTVPVDATVLNARQAAFVLRTEITKQLKRGIEGLCSTLVRTIDIAVSNGEEFELLFSMQEPTRRVGKTETVLTVEGMTKVQKHTSIFSFRTLREWANFVRDKPCYAADHKCPTTGKYLLLVPAAQLANRKSFDSADARWAALETAGKVPMALSRKVPLATSLKSKEGRAAIADAREVTVFLLDSIELEGHGLFYYAFVRDGYVHGATPQMYTVVKGKRMYGHVGYVPASVLTWSGKGHRPICATYSEYRRVCDGIRMLGIPGVGNARLYFRSTAFAKASGKVA